jgi:GLPGLI family protein
MPKETIVTLWYTEICNQGPDKYWGLPGLILEVNDGKTVILCSKVVLNSKTKAEIKATKRKEISKEFDETSIKKNARNERDVSRTAVMVVVNLE